MKHQPPWGKAGKGKFFKRRLNKARRRYTKALIRNPQTHERGLRYLESEVNYRAT